MVASPVSASEVKLTAQSPAKSREKSREKSPAGSAAESAAKAAPKPASSTTTATGGSTGTAGYLGAWPRPVPRSSPREEQQRSTSHKKPGNAFQERGGQSSVKEKEAKVAKQQKAAKAERPTNLGHHQSEQARGRRGRGQGRDRGSVKEEKKESQAGLQIRGNAERRPLPPQQPSVPAVMAPVQLTPCRAPYCQGNLTPETRFCPLCGTPRQEVQGGYGMPPTIMAPYQGPWSGSSPFQYASSPLSAYGTLPSPMPQQSPAPTPPPYGGYAPYHRQYRTPAPPYGYPAYFGAPPPSMPPPPFAFSGYNAMTPSSSPAPSVNCYLGVSSTTKSLAFARRILRKPRNTSTRSLVPPRSTRHQRRTSLRKQFGSKIKSTSIL